MNNIPQALYQKVKQHLLAHIQNGTWPVHHRLPSEHELTAQFGVSRMTVNRALRELAAEGRLVRLQGVGTFVAPPKAQSALFEVRSIAEEIARRGGKHHCRVLSVQALATDAATAEALNLPAGAHAYRSMIVHFENHVPIQYEDRWVNPAAVPDYLAQDFHHITPHDYLTAVTPFSEGEHIIEAVLPPKHIAAALAMARGEPCLVVERRTWSGKLAVTQVRLWFAAGRYRLQGRFSAD
ncbi:histidine utilization repressor [Conchiformibius steedae DSM 2580]|uniref:Histidine utilization repressor n=1 Tax=Conchiformibius steedae DSM 2580 TaxID=1121352 RepID=A0AAE9HX40_9NEIS|nr:histidine utilization repressor [Conchiformibius steedae]QMT33572.1 histidine utilization repressor [Conchiformibius steedae]URD68231.1 histidine utilization repressor [Conchiformibius steedae DSM 2580]